MTRSFSGYLLQLCAAALTASTVAAEFVPPKAYPRDRYEAGWDKNPFTLKAAPITPQKDSFAKDLALAGWRQAGDDIIVILVNTQTRAYTRLKNSEPGPTGMVVRNAHLEDKRADSFVELEFHGENATVKYDENFNHQMVAKTHPTGNAANSATHPAVGPNGMPVNGAGGQPPPAAAAAAAAAASGPNSAAMGATPYGGHPAVAPGGPQNSTPVFPTNQTRMTRTLPRPVNLPQP